MMEIRSTAVERIRLQLFGPVGGPEEEIKGKPYWRYMSGILFPRNFAAESLGESDEPDTSSSTTESEGSETDPAIGLSYKELPSSMGVSFFIAGGTRVECAVEAGAYLRTDTNGAWKRVPIAPPDNPSIATFECPRSKQRKLLTAPVANGRAYVSVLFRPKDNGHLVTATLVNAREATSSAGARQTEDMLFQCRMTVRLIGGSIGEYPRIPRFSKHPEDEELALVYRNRKTYGIGHGCAAQWNPTCKPGTLHEIVAEPLPTCVVKGLTNDIRLPASAVRALSIEWLSRRSQDTEELRRALDTFVDAYETWTIDQDAAARELPRHLQEPAKRLCDRQKHAVKRMRRGIKALTSGADPKVLEAFRIAQEAMLTQFLWVRRQSQPRTLGHGVVDPVSVDLVPPADRPAWRPFQLAFQLLTVASVVDAEDPDRLALDLLWFPTGGGKTEAYLALTALEIALRRLRYGESGSGTAVIMRYTLRLLTSQQFERCATLISVLETMRRSRPELRLGDRPISLGLWVGGGTTPNRLTSDDANDPGAVQMEERIRNAARPENSFQLLACPYCGTRIVPERRGAALEYGLQMTSTRFKLFCPEPRCQLHDEIPVSVVDDDLYARPPSLLIGTIDKFARTVWEPRSGAFFGLGSTELLPPSLIIQDELHLINGPLGTIAGLYEAAIDTVIKSRGITPKYLAATATIQRAGDQCRALYARDAFVFPPAGLDASDSFFTREDDQSPGRLYLGVMGPGLYSALTALVQSSAAAADAVQTIDPDSVSADGTSLRDSYWTQVIYHNSRQELGKTTTMLRDDVRTRLEVLEPNRARRRHFDSVVELSANLKGAEISDALDKLKVPYPKKGAIDALACTNMISVGVDVPRLGLMIVKGQPKGNAEYIQASSRVGRSRQRPPGIVIALYTSFRPRDRSHYETFQAFHQALYRAVEPSSVTPFSPPALDRTLHAGLVMVVRHLLQLTDVQDARRFDDAAAARVISEFLIRLEDAARSDERQSVGARLQKLVADWRSEATDPNGPPLVFHSNSVQFRSLLRMFEQRDADGLWPTLNSMRHVDGETRFEVAEA